MSKTWLCLGVSILGILLPASSGLNAQAVESQTFSSDSLQSPSFLIAQQYGSITGNLSKLEIEGDAFYSQGTNALNKRDYYQAHLSFDQAAGRYWQCKADYLVQGRKGDADRVLGKYNNAKNQQKSAFSQINR